MSRVARLQLQQANFFGRWWSVTLCVSHTKFFKRKGKLQKEEYKRSGGKSLENFLVSHLFELIFQGKNREIWGKGKPAYSKWNAGGDFIPFPFSESLITFYSARFLRTFVESCAESLCTLSCSSRSSLFSLSIWLSSSPWDPGGMAATPEPLLLVFLLLLSLLEESRNPGGIPLEAAATLYSCCREERGPSET